MVNFHAHSYKSLNFRHKFLGLFFIELKMVSKVEGVMKKKQQWKKTQNQKSLIYRKEIVMQCNKSNTPKFKRSTSYFEDDGVSAAILLLACIACRPSSYI